MFSDIRGFKVFTNAVLTKIIGVIIIVVATCGAFHNVTFTRTPTRGNQMSFMITSSNVSNSNLCPLDVGVSSNMEKK